MARGSPRWHLPKAYSNSKGLCGARSAPRFQTVMCLNRCCSCSTLGDCAFIERLSKAHGANKKLRKIHRLHMVGIILLLFLAAYIKYQQLLESVRRKSVLARLSNDRGSRLLGRLFYLEFLGFCLPYLKTHIADGILRVL